MKTLLLGAAILSLTGCATWKTDLKCSGYALMGLTVVAASSYVPPEIQSPPHSVAQECGWDQPAPFLTRDLVAAVTASGHP